MFWSYNFYIVWGIWRIVFWSNDFVSSLKVVTFIMYTGGKPLIGEKVSEFRIYCQSKWSEKMKRLLWIGSLRERLMNGVILRQLRVVYFILKIHLSYYLYTYVFHGKQNKDTFFVVLRVYKTIFKINKFCIFVFNLKVIRCCIIKILRFAPIELISRCLVTFGKHIIRTIKHFTIRV